MANEAEFILNGDECSVSSSYIMTIRSVGSTIYIDNFADGFDGLQANYNGTTLRISNQTGIKDDKAGLTWDITDVYINIVNGSLDVDYAINDFDYAFNCGYVNCFATGSRI